MEREPPGAGHMELDNPVVKLCLEGTRAEFDGRIEDACAFYAQAWQMAQDDYDMCVAAHYMARHQENPRDVLRWNQEALKHADALGDERVHNFYPSLYVNMGHAYEKLGNQDEADRYYQLAANLGLVHQAE
jgi:tetratricopeptide (TPR) repeat protein